MPRFATSNVSFRNWSGFWIAKRKDVGHGVPAVPGEPRAVILLEGGPERRDQHQDGGRIPERSGSRKGNSGTPPAVKEQEHPTPYVEERDVLTERAGHDGRGRRTTASAPPPRRER